MIDYKEYNRVMYLRNKDFKKQLDIKNDLYIPTEEDKRLMYENLLLTKLKKDDTI